MHDKEACDRLCLSNGQFYGRQKLKNQWWFLNGKEIGFGDLRPLDIFRIADFLFEHETFEAYNEHHGTRFQQRENPTLVIKGKIIEFPDYQRVTDETRRKLWLEKGPW